MMLRAAALLAAVATASGHASVIMPPSRNAIDGEAGTPWCVGRATQYARPALAGCCDERPAAPLPR